MKLEIDKPSLTKVVLPLAYAVVCALITVLSAVGALALLPSWLGWAVAVLGWACTYIHECEWYWIKKRAAEEK